MSHHRVQIAKAVLVTILWSSSWILIKWGLEDISPLLFASIRYLLAGGILTAMVLSKADRIAEFRELRGKELALLAVYGLMFISFTQGLQFVALDLLPAITISFVLNFSTFVVIIISALLLRERPTGVQLLFFALALVAGVMYFSPFESFEITTVGIAVLVGVLLSNSLSQILGRYLNHRLKQGALVITSVSMMIGAILLFGFAISVESPVALAPQVILLVVWLAVINTAFAFTLWNSTMEFLKAYESSIINNTMLPQITLLAVIFLGERPSPMQWISLAIMVISAIAVVAIEPSKRE
ncbi:MAG: DMT family transporter [Candidatus Kariarchaeaceae archaeon]|jgi:drug/metabolite transporter (DMT)-like permease